MNHEMTTNTNIARTLGQNVSGMKQHIQELRKTVFYANETSLCGRNGQCRRTNTLLSDNDLKDDWTFETFDIDTIFAIFSISFDTFNSINNCDILFHHEFAFRVRILLLFNLLPKFIDTLQAALRLSIRRQILVCLV